MLDLTRFSDLFANLGAGFNGFAGKAARPSQSPQVQPATLQDVLDLTSVGSNSPAASFDRASQSPIAVNDSGIYRPTQVQHRLGASLNFSFNLSVQHAAVVQRPAQHSEARTTSSTEFAYEQLTEARREVNGSYSELRRFQTDLFFSRTRTLSQQLSTETGQHLDDTSQQVARRFELEISLDFSFLRQFNVQSESLADDEATLEDYLGGVDGLAGRSGQALQAFFDEVDRILADTESFVQNTLGQFLIDVKAAFGLNDNEARDFSAQVAEEVAAFFSEVDTFLNDARQALSAPPTPPALDSPAEEPEQALV